MSQPTTPPNSDRSEFDEAAARALLAGHFRLLASAVNVTDWPAYLRDVADAHDAGTAYLARPDNDEGAPPQP